MSVVDIRQYETLEERHDRVLSEARETIDRLSAELDDVLADRAALLATIERELTQPAPEPETTRDPHLEGELHMAGVTAVVERPKSAHHMAVVHIPADDLSQLIERGTCPDCDAYHGDEHHEFYADDLAAIEDVWAELDG